MNDEFLGYAVVDGVSRFYSVSALERADTRQSGCMRKFWYRYVARIKEAMTDSKNAGVALHAEIAQYLRTGVPALSALAMSGMHIMPNPGSDLLIEQKIHTVDRTGIHSLIGANGTPLIGFIDCTHARGTNKGGGDIEQMYDPKGTIEIIDWKWKKDGAKAEYYTDERELVRSIQMSGYGLALGRHFGASYVRLSHGYFPATRGKPRKVTKLHVLDDCAKTWEYVDALGRTIADVVRERSPERVPANPHACDRFGGCPYREAPVKCTGYQSHSLAGLFGETTGKDIAMGLMSTLPPAQQPAPIQQPAVDLRLQIATEEAAQRATAQQTSVGVIPGFADAWAAIERSGRGFPALAGAAAQMRAALAGVAINPQAGLAGAGDLGGIMFQDPAHVVQLGGELAAAARQAQPAPAPIMQQLPIAPVAQPVQHVQHNAVATSVLPPDAPASNPALAAKPLEAAPGSGGFLQQLAAQGIAPITPPPAPIAAQLTQLPAQPLTVVQNFTPPATSATPAQTPLPTDGGSKRKRRTTAEMQAAAQPGQPASVQIDTGDLEVYVDCMPNGDFESLHPYVDNILAKLVEKFCPPPCVPDVRCAPKDGPLGFGGWRGAIRAIVLELPPADGRLYLDTRNNEIACEVADAMRVHCERRGALYVKGLR